MIEVAFSPGTYALSVRGHALAGPPGQDLVCCAASALVCTLAANARAMEARGWTGKTRVILEPGQAEVLCIPKKGCCRRVRDAMEAVCLGFSVLESLYPECVRYRDLSGPGAEEKKEEDHDH